MVRLEGGGTCVAQLRAEAENLIHSIHCDETEAKANSNPPSTFLKEKLPSQWERLPGLRPGMDEEMTDDPEAMATLAGDYWAKELLVLLMMGMKWFLSSLVGQSAGLICL